MKANEAPEKIYVHRTIHLGLLEASEMNITGSDIEYTRTDAFIEKMEKYLKNQFINDVSVLSGGAVHINFSTAIKNFINYMKGE